MRFDNRILKKAILISSPSINVELLIRPFVVYSKWSNHASDQCHSPLPHAPATAPFHSQGSPCHSPMPRLPMARYQAPNPWNMGVLPLLAEIYAVPNLKMNLKFEIEDILGYFIIRILRVLHNQLQLFMVLGMMEFELKGYSWQGGDMSYMMYNNLRPIEEVVHMQRKNLQMCLRSTSICTDAYFVARILQN
ncbi:hypothetical protein R6Q59_024001 [Mikania micrantha]